jgi:hypothetical protein
MASEEGSALVQARSFARKVIAGGKANGIAIGKGDGKAGGKIGGETDEEADMSIVVVSRHTAERLQRAERYAFFIGSNCDANRSGNIPGRNLDPWQCI